ncbi:hypothetical protein [Planomicrobium sp. YIM 101495]|uniref:hypothetical protein n=1 Tax=Planomicrobium sp. YIM 101495 TaxID=2665160 RepID=UPI0012B9639C|nr:hypothetical protein [Planomicrobium sp. YIM 101495]MTD32013.1 hypothetical protein [Planomicrobium sp. YIM 101495]
MKRCKVCRKKPRLERRVDSDGNLFCSDGCFEVFEGGPDDFDHPYIDDYESIRRSYIDWEMSYEEDLHKSVYFLYPKKADLIEWIDEMLEPYWGCYGLEGHDGVFSAEIYRYMQELLKIQEVIRDWEPDERKYKKWLKGIRTAKSEQTN